MFLALCIIQVFCFVAMFVFHVWTVGKHTKKIAGVKLDIQQAKMNLDTEGCHHCSFAYRKLNEAIGAL